MKNLKFLVSAALVAITFSIPQAIHGMERFSRDEGQKNPLGMQFQNQEIEEIEEIGKRLAALRVQAATQNNHPPSPPLQKLEQEAAEARRSEGQEVVAEFKKIMWLGVDPALMPGRAEAEAKDPVEREPAMPLVARGHEAIYKRFLNGVLIYRPQQGSRVGMVTLPIAKLENPLEGTFDLSKCGDTDKYLSIATGYRKAVNPANANKVEIWFTPRFLIEKELKVTATQFQPIFGNWSERNAVGTFWTWGADALEYYDYLSTQTMDELGNDNLYEKWSDAKRGRCSGAIGCLLCGRCDGVSHALFYVHFG